MRRRCIGLQMVRALSLYIIVSTPTAWNVPESCSTTCGDGIIRGAEICDDGSNNNIGCATGCLGSAVGWQCDGSEPTTCSEICGDGIRVGNEGMSYYCLDHL